MAFRLAYLLFDHSKGHLKVKVKVMHIQTVKISQTVTGEALLLPTQESRTWLFDGPTYILPWLILKVKLKVMYITTVNISQKGDRYDKHYYCQHGMSYAAVRLAWLHSTLARSNGHGETVASFTHKQDGRKVAG